MQERESAFLQEFISRFKVLFAFTGEAGDQIAGDGNIRDPFADRLDSIIILGGVIGTVHPRQHAVASRLQRDVQVAGDAPVILHQFQQLVIHLRHFYGGDAEALNFRRGRQHPLQQAGQAESVFPSVAAGMNAGEDDFTVMRAEAHGLLTGGFRIQAALPAAGIGYHAVAAELVAAVLDLQIGPGLMLKLVGQQRRELLRRNFVHQHQRPLFLVIGFQNIRNLLLMRGADDQIRVRHFLRPHLRVAADHGHDRLRIEPAHAVHHLPALLGGGVGDRARENQGHVRRLLKRHPLIAPLFQARSDAFRLVGIHFAAQAAD